MKTNPNKPTRSLRCANALALALLVLGSLQMIGFLTGVRTLRGIGAASVASPLPKVFCSAPLLDGSNESIETFSSTFALVYELDEQTHTMQLTPETSANLRGPYNRRNVYGAALSYAPCLPRPVVDRVLQFGLQGDSAPLLEEFEIPQEATGLRLVIQSESGGKSRSWEFPVPSQPSGISKDSNSIAHRS